MQRLQKTEGFTLIELMIVVAIISIIAAIAIPSLLKAKISGNEASAQASLRTVSTVSEQHRNRFNSYPADLTALQSNGYVDSTLGAGSKSGYTFVLAGLTTTWTCTASPTTASDGDRYFFVDESGVIRWADGAAATVTSPPIQ
jgi:type IV pilus assembly protein PilE